MYATVDWFWHALMYIDTITKAIEALAKIKEENMKFDKVALQWSYSKNAYSDHLF